MVTPFSSEMLRLYRFWKEGVLPFAGGLYDQPEIIARAMAAVQARLDLLAVQAAEQRK